MVSHEKALDIIADSSSTKHKKLTNIHPWHMWKIWSWGGTHRPTCWRFHRTVVRASTIPWTLSSWHTRSGASSADDDGEFIFLLISRHTNALSCSLSNEYWNLSNVLAFLLKLYSNYKRFVFVSISWAGTFPSLLHYDLSFVGNLLHYLGPLWDCCHF